MLNPDDRAYVGLARAFLDREVALREAERRNEEMARKLALAVYELRCHGLLRLYERRIAHPLGHLETLTP